jgi:hypothetical protein
VRIRVKDQKRKAYAILLAITFRDLGFNKSASEETVLQEATYLGN